MTQNQANELELYVRLLGGEEGASLREFIKELLGKPRDSSRMKPVGLIAPRGPAGASATWRDDI